MISSKLPVIAPAFPSTIERVREKEMRKKKDYECEAINNTNSHPLCVLLFFWEKGKEGGGRGMKGEKEIKSLYNCGNINWVSFTLSVRRVRA